MESSRKPSKPSTPSAAVATGEQLDARALARSRREALRLRTRRIRQAVTALALGLFVAAFLGVYVQLATGHDPALTAAAKRRASSTTAAGVSAKKTSTDATGESEATTSTSEAETATGGSEASSGTGTGTGQSATSTAGSSAETNPATVRTSQS